VEISSKQRFRSNPIGRLDGVILVLFFLYGLASQYFVLTLIAGYVLVVILKSLWKPFCPPVLLYFISLQWLQVFASILYADFLGVGIPELFGSHDIEFLFIMTFLQILVITLVLKNYVRVTHTLNVTKEKLAEAAERLNTRNIIIAYFVSAIFVPLIPSLTKGNASLYQLMISFGILKYMFVGMLVFILLLKRNKNSPLIIGILIFDFIISFASFFSDFKTLLIMIIVIYFTVNPTLRRDALLRMLPVVLLLLLFFSFWSYVKGGYREFLNQGLGRQVKTVSNTDALKYMYNEATTFEVGSIKEGASVLLSRVQYMERYSEVYYRVPAEIEHQDGKDLASVVEFLLVPRIINENKGVKDASVRTSYYTGQEFSNSSQGTSISMGYFCDLYIDFGLYIMFIPLILLYILIGIIYQKLITLRKYNIIFVYALTVGFFLSLGAFESDSLFFLGLIRNNLAFMVIGYYTFFKFLHKALVNK